MINPSLLSSQDALNQAFQEKLADAPYSTDWLIYGDFLEETGNQSQADSARRIGSLAQAQDTLSPEELWDRTNELVKLKDTLPLPYNFYPHYFLRDRCRRSQEFYYDFCYLFFQKFKLFNDLLEYHLSRCPTWGWPAKGELQEIRDSLRFVMGFTNGGPRLGSLNELTLSPYFPDISRELRLFNLWWEIQPDLKSLLRNKERFQLDQEWENRISFFLYSPLG